MSSQNQPDIIRLNFHSSTLPIDLVHDSPYDPNTGRRLAVAGLIQYDGKYLLAKRLPGPKPTSGKWEFPGGKVEPGESDRQALIREIQEEFSVTIKTGPHLATSYTASNYIIKLYRAYLNSPDLQLHVHTDHVWIRHISNALDYDLTPATRDLAITTILKRIELT